MVYAIVYTAGFIFLLRLAAQPPQVGESGPPTGIPTRTAGITGAFVALNDCLAWMEGRGMVERSKVLKDHIAAISCGIYKGEPVLDLDYLEDSAADTDANFVMTGRGGIVEIQGTAEKEPFSEAELASLLGLAKSGIATLVELQRQAIA